MAKSLLFVESNPALADVVEEYHHWHDQVHVPEMLRHPLRARHRHRPHLLRAAFADGRMSKPVAVDAEPPPVMCYLSLVNELARSQSSTS